MTTNKTIKSKNQPKQTNVTWVDLSGKTPVEKHFINGRWRPIGGGGAGSTNPTEADATKVWQVTPVQKGTKTEETVIVPEQTCNMEDDSKQTICILQNVDENFREGFSGIAILDGIEYNVEWLESYSGFGITESVGIWLDVSDIILWDADKGLTHTIKVITRETESVYDYNWAPGVKIPIPTAEDEGKILVVTKTEGDTSIIVPEQEVPADDETPLTDVDLKYFVLGNTVTVTVTEPDGQRGGDVALKGPKSANSQTFTATGVIEESNVGAFVSFNKSDNFFIVYQEDNSLFTNTVDLFSSDATIKLEYLEPNYEYQLQENSGSGSTSNVLWPAMYEYNDNEVIATFVPEDVEPGTWCMVCGTDSYSKPVCYPVLISSYQNYILYNDDSVCINVNTAFGGVGELLTITRNVQLRSTQL